MKKGQQIIEIECDRIRPFADQPRKYFDAAALKDLERSIKAAGQQVEIRIRRLPAPDGRRIFELIDGQRRWLACSALKIMVRAIVDSVADPEDQFLASIASNFGRADHTPMEIANAIARLRKRPEIARIQNREEQTSAVGAIFGKSFGWVYQYEKLLRLAPPLQAALNSDRLGMRVAEHLAMLEHHEQLNCFEFMCEHLQNRDQQIVTARGWSRRLGKDRGGKKTPYRTPYTVRSAVTEMTAAASRLIGLNPAEIAAAIEKLVPGDQQAILTRISALIDHLTKLKQVAMRVTNSRRAAA